MGALGEGDRTVFRQSDIIIDILILGCADRGRWIIGFVSIMRLRQAKNKSASLIRCSSDFDSARIIEFVWLGNRGNAKVIQLNRLMK